MHYFERLTVCDITGLSVCSSVTLSLAKEKPVGWYHSGPKLRSSDLDINELFKRYSNHPVLVIIDVKPKELGLPTDAYIAVEEIHDVRLRESRIRLPQLTVSKQETKSNRPALGRDDYFTDVCARYVAH